MLKDHGVSDEDATYYESRINDGGIFVSVDAGEDVFHRTVANSLAERRPQRVAAADGDSVTIVQWGESSPIGGAPPIKGILLTCAYSTADWSRLMFDASLLWAEAGMVVAMRSWRLMAGGPAAERELQRMVGEKAEAGSDCRRLDGRAPENPGGRGAQDAVGLWQAGPGKPQTPGLIWRLGRLRPA